MTDLVEALAAALDNLPQWAMVGPVGNRHMESSRPGHYWSIRDVWEALRDVVPTAILAIEAEARSARDAEVRALLDDVPRYTLEPDDSAYMELDPDGRYVIFDEVEAILDTNTPS